MVAEIKPYLPSDTEKRCYPLKELLNMKKSLTSLFALAFVLMFGLMHAANAEKHMAPAAKADAAAPADAKKEMKEEKKAEPTKKVSKKKKVTKKEKKEEMKKEAAPVITPAPSPQKQK